MEAMERIDIAVELAAELIDLFGLQGKLLARLAADHFRGALELGHDVGLLRLV